MSAATGYGKEPGPSTSSSVQLSQQCRHFTLSDILIATKNFDESLVIGRGGFGKVYRGTIFNGSATVLAAIKRLDPSSNQGAHEFWAEVEMLSKLRHCNLVSLFGYCIIGQEMILVYEYMPNGTLEDHLHKLDTQLSWVQRLNICIGACRGLHYLHTGTGVDVGVIHRDVKTSNILLQKSWAAKISDFGLSKIGPTNQPITYVNTRVKGTFGYLDPDYYATGKLTRKSDVYAFGVVLLEVLCRKRAIFDINGEPSNLANWAQESIKEGSLKNIIDFDIRGQVSPKCSKEFFRIAGSCLHSSPKKRSSMAEVLSCLESILSMQEKFNNSMQRRTILDRIVNMLPFPSNGENTEDVKEIFKKYSGDGVHMTSDQFKRFLKDDDQGGGAYEVTVSEAQFFMEQIISKRHLLAKLFYRKTLSLEDFHRFLFSTELNPPIRSQVHQDMNAPLSHYFIYTGHNSYLTGNQLDSNCSEVPIINALRRGVRVIELHLWPNSSKDNVHVLHEMTMSTPVELSGCLKTIKENAFIASAYPVIITFEDHLTSDLQAKVAQMVTETFGAMLFCPESEKLKELPTPESLTYRILISTKPSKVFLEAADDKRSSSQKGQLSDVNDDAWSDDRSFKSGSDGSDGDLKTEDLLEAKILPVYKNLIAIHADKPKGGLKDALKVEKDKVRRLSLAEQGLERAVENHGQDVLRFTQKNILEIYPTGTRIASSNYKLLTAWLHGAQMVAFNMQGYGRSLWLMHGMFRANGGCGYVKKPDFLMKCGPENEVFSPKAKLPAKKTLKVKIYMGDGWRLDFKKTHFDKYSPPDLYTKVAIAGAPVDEKKERTKYKEDNWTPVWNEEFKFPLSVPELALLRIEVRDYIYSEKDRLAGQICLPVSELRPGIRAIPLCNRKGDPYSSARLLVRFEFI